MRCVWNARTSSAVAVSGDRFSHPANEQLKGYLKRLGVAFRVRDLLMDEDAQDRLDEARIRSTPVLEVDGVIYAGSELTPEKVRALVGA